MTENKNQDLSMSRAKLNQDVYKEIYKDDETEFGRETYRKENKINALFKEENLDDTFELKFSDMEAIKKRDQISIETYIDLDRADRPEKIDPTASLDEYFSANIEEVEEVPTITEKPVEEETSIEDELNQLLESKFKELDDLKTNLEDSKAKLESIEEDYTPTVDTDLINVLLSPQPISKEELLGDQEVETEELEDFIINSLIDNINGNNNSNEKVAVDSFTETNELPNEKLFELTSTLSVEGLSEIEESIQRNNRIIKILIVILIVIIFVLGYYFISGS